MRLNTVILGVGEEVDLSFSPGLVTNAAWTCTWSSTAGSVVPSFATSTHFTAPSNAPSGGTGATVTATLGDENLDVDFGVVKPSGVDRVGLVSLFPYAQGWAGAGMYVTVYLAPTNVSFYRVQCMEVGQDATNIWGYFSQYTPQQLAHDDNAGANRWISVGCDNSWDHSWDKAESNPYYPWSAGGFTWQIPGKWKIDSGRTNDIHFSDQTFEIEPDGTMVVTKFEHRVTRRTSEEEGTYK